MNRWRQRVLDAVFVTTEAVVWFMGIRVFASVAERAYLIELEARLVGAVELHQVDGGGAPRALLVVRDALDSPAGPSIWLIILVAGSAFLMMRGLSRARLGPGLGAAAVLLGSVAILNLFLHIAIAGDVRFWDVQGFISFMGDQSPYFVASVDLAEFVRDPVLTGSHGGTLTVVVAGLTGMWLRFLLAARSNVTFERVLGSFGAGFLAVLVIMAVAAFVGAGGLAPYGVAYFILGAVALAIANRARVTPTEGERREAPWAAAVTGTVALLVIGSLLVGLIAYFNGAAALQLLGTAALRAFEVVLSVIVYPLFWIFETIFRLVLPDTPNDVLERLDRFRLVPEDAEIVEDGAIRVPGGVLNLLKFLAAIALGYVLFLLARLLFGRRGGTTDLAEATGGEATSTPTGLRALLRDLMPGPRAPTGASWTRGRPIYRLFVRTLNAAEERGLNRLPGETPVEFSNVSARLLDGPDLATVGAAFDRARYGRHFPANEETARLAQAVAAWELRQPATEELRERIAGARSITRDDAFALKIQLAKRQDQTTADRMGPSLDDF